MDGDPAQADWVSRVLSSAGHACTAMSDAQSLMGQLQRESFDLVVLEWDAPDSTGAAVMRWMHQKLCEYVPVLFLTRNGRETDISWALNSGADDYIIKPIAAGLLIARVTALLRRVYGLNHASNKATFGDIEFDLTTKQAFVRGLPVTLKRKEFELALLLFQHMSRPLSREHIRDLIWKRSIDVPSRTMDTHVSVLRAKLGLRPEHGYRLIPIYGYGYRLEKLDAAESLPVRSAHQREEAVVGT